jgi:hypothetical protein
MIQNLKKGYGMAAWLAWRGSKRIETIGIELK